MNRRAPLLLALLIATLLLALLLPPLIHGEAGFFWSWGNGRFMASQAGVLGIGALGMLLVVAVGGIDLSAAAIVALAGSATAAWLGKGGSPALALLIGMGAGLGAGAINGAAVAITRCSAALVTLATAGAYSGLALAWAPEHELPATWLGALLAPYPVPGFLLVAPVFWLALLLAGLLTLLMRYTALGVHWLAIGSNEEAASGCGIVVGWRRALAYLLAGGCFGAIGAMQAGILREAPPLSAVLLVEIIAAALLGRLVISGAARVWATLLAAVAITLLRNAAQQAGWPSWAQAVLVAAILIAALDAGRRSRAREP